MTAQDQLIATSVRPSWDDLPPKVRDAVHAVTNSPITRANTQSGGFSCGLAVRLLCADGSRLFVKGIATDHALYDRYSEEALINTALPDTVPVAPLLRTWETDGWLLMAFEDIDGRHPDITPGSADLPRLQALLTDLPQTVTPSPLTHAPDFATAVGGEFHGWRLLAEAGTDLDPWAARNLDRLIAIERDWTQAADGTTLLHADLRPDNLLFTDKAERIIDWAYLHQGAAWVDPTMLLPHLIRAGHTPEQAETVLTAVPAWNSAPADAITSFAVAFTGYWDRSSRLPDPPGVPCLRAFQTEMAAIGRQWIAHRTGWR